MDTEFASQHKQTFLCHMFCCQVFICGPWLEAGIRRSCFVSDCWQRHWGKLELLTLTGVQCTLSRSVSAQLSEVTVYVAMTPEMATMLATHGSVAPNTRVVGASVRQERRQGVSEKIQYTYMVDHVFLTDCDGRRSRCLWIRTPRTI